MRTHFVKCGDTVSKIKEMLNGRFLHMETGKTYSSLKRAVNAAKKYMQQNKPVMDESEKLLNELLAEFGL